ncbi:MAG: tRNA threonylcarbamoyladenosine dehydratase [Proteobacteria bacterium]|nr:MAG: tRNA threonylcarbamoyladenosine dehydratase [Pseudomonadota bacterium]
MNIDLNMIAPQFFRTEILLGSSAIDKLANRHVLIAGVGGVGGYAVEAIARAGIGKLTIIDNDVVDITNINRQLIADLNNVGQSKVAEFAARILAINPNIQLNALPVFIEENNLAELLADKPDYVIDCIDTINSKLALIKYCLRNKIKIISSMGAGNRIDVSKVKVADISKTQVCALARNIRLRLRQDGIRKGLKVVYSEEVPFAKPLADPDGGRPTNGTISYLPALFGINLAGIVMKELIIND